MDKNAPLPDTIQGWNEYLNGVNPNVIKLGLERVRFVAARLGVDKPRDGVKVITVAGTNGKGSTAVMLASILEQAGYRTGLYTSPHILRFSERIIYGGVEASEDDLIEAFRTVYKAQDEEHQLTFFEFTTLAALLIFKNRLCDVLVLEVGLGGRLDAVNILDADIALIPSIGLDHCHILGDTIAKIAFEKAGIIKEHTKAVVTGALEDETISEIQKQAKKTHTVVHSIGSNIKIDFKDATHFSILEPVEISDLEVPSLPLINAPLSVVAAILLRMAFKLDISDSDIRRGLKSAVLHGRLEYISKNPDVLIDVAHNPPAAHYLASRLLSVPKNRYAVIGMLKDKDIRSTLHEMTEKNIFEKFFVCSLPGERGASQDLVADALLNNGVSQASIKKCSTVSNAYKEALAELPSGYELVVFGSFVTVEELLRSIHTEF